MLDSATIALINGLGSLKAIAISHPHFYTTMVEWSRAFGGIPIHLHADATAGSCVLIWRSNYGMARL